MYIPRKKIVEIPKICMRMICADSADPASSPNRDAVATGIADIKNRRVSRHVFQSFDHIERSYASDENNVNVALDKLFFVRSRNNYHRN